LSNIAETDAKPSPARLPRLDAVRAGEAKIWNVKARAADEAAAMRTQRACP
jgi:hypothetical protein